MTLLVGADIAYTYWSRYRTIVFPIVSCRCRTSTIGAFIIALLAGFREFIQKRNAALSAPTIKMHRPSYLQIALPTLIDV